METAKCLTFEDLKPGQRVRVHQMIDRRARDWHCRVEGVVQAAEVSKTGSWYAHGKDDKLWLRRVRLVKDGGELTVLNLDRWSEVELLD